VSGLLKPNICDGFSMNARLFELPYRYFPLALGQIAWFRCRNDYRAKWYLIPEDFTVPVAAFDTYIEQVRIEPGSWLYGYNYTSLDGTGSDAFIEIQDPCSGSEFFQSPCVMRSVVPNAPNNNTRLWPTLLTEPHLIRKPGLIVVKISNRLSVSQRVQFMLHCAEPCVLTEGQ
jgi:hypothetical protein